MSRIRLTIVLLCLSPVGIVLMNQACSPMESKLGATVGLTSSKSKDVCSADYAPTTFSKALAKSANDKYVSPFEQQKVYLTEDVTSQLSGKAAASLKDKKVIVILRNCNVNEPSSLSAKVLSQNGPYPDHRLNSAFKYLIKEDISSSEFEAQASSDACVVGVTLPGTISTSTLPIPETNDPDVAKEVQLSVTNYFHAYENLVVPQRSGSPKVKVGFIDTGVDCSHPDLAANIAVGCGYNVINPGSLPTDTDGHGSNTAGIVGAVSNNGVGITGIAGNAVTISAFKVIDQGTGTVEDSFDGIQEAISRGVDIINISLQSTTRLISIENAVGDAVHAGIVVILAAGNQGGELMSSVTVSPAAVGKGLAGAITVGSIDTVSGDLSYFSNYGSYVEIAAPGAVDGSAGGAIGGLYSTYKQNQYMRMMGTSQAAPVVAGAAALLIQFFKDKGVSYTPALIEQLILASSDAPFFIPIDGHRVLNFSKLTRNAYHYAGIDLCGTN